MSIRRTLSLGRLPALCLICFICAVIFTLRLHSLISSSIAFDEARRSIDQAVNYRRDPDSTLAQLPLNNEAEEDDKGLLDSPRQDWTKFVRLTDDIFLYSVILDLRDGNMDYPCVRVVVVARSRLPVTCIFFDRSSVSATFYELSENHAMPFGAFVINCKIPKHIEPKTVASFALQQEALKVSVNVHYTVTEKVPVSLPLEYGICVPVLFGARYRPAHLVEFMELNRIFGAGHVFIYLQHDAMSNEMKKAVDYYKSKRYVI